MTTATLGGVGRAALWRLLSLGFTSPTAGTVAEVEALAEGLAEAGAMSEVEDVLTEVRGARIDEVAAQFSSLHRGTVRVPPYEGSYELDPIRQGRQMADVAAFYRAFGAEAHGPAAERPDNVGCELEFLSFLELRHLAAVESGEPDAGLVEEIGTAFLADHAGRWLPTFFGEVQEAASHAPFYRALAALGTRVIADELARREIPLAPQKRRHTLLSVEGDSFSCAGAQHP